MGYLITNCNDYNVHRRIDGNNSLYYGLPNNQLQRLQRIQNAVARVLTLRKRFEHTTPVLKELQWLPIKYRVQTTSFDI